MRFRRVIIYFVAFFFLALLIGPYALILALLVPLVDYYISRRCARVTYPDTSLPEAVVPVDEELGEPSATIIVNPTRGNEAVGVVLVYDQQALLVYNGIVIRKPDIVDVSFNNSAIPYLPTDYQVVITTRDPDHPTIHIPVGSDSHWAMEVVVQIKQHIQ